MIKIDIDKVAHLCSNLGEPIQEFRVMTARQSNAVHHDVNIIAYLEILDLGLKPIKFFFKGMYLITSASISEENDRELTISFCPSQSFFDMVKAVYKTSATPSSFILNICKKLIFTGSFVWVHHVVIINCVHILKFISVKNLVCYSSTSFGKDPKGCATHWPWLVIENHQVLSFVADLFSGTSYQHLILLPIKSCLNLSVD